ncbi:MAG: PAS domain S-box protein, partial [Candidatus Sericytochromatia bacterium]
MKATPTDALEARTAWDWMLATRHTGFGLAAAVFAAGLGLAARLSLTPLLEDRLALLFFVPGVVAAAALGGAGPGAVATVLGFACGLYVTWLTTALTMGDFAGAVVFLLLGLMISAGGEAFQNMRSRAALVNLDLRAREAHLQSILATVPDAMVVITESGAIQSFSLAAERLFGWTADEVIGR